MLLKISHTYLTLVYATGKLVVCNIDVNAFICCKYVPIRIFNIPDRILSILRCSIRLLLGDKYVKH